ncbi:MAG TPA: hypothetical protein VGS41_10860 [Chthonomonadales bacterium]|nr:hypothetical protein [Chthonomonadales bacterium]
MDEFDLQAQSEAEADEDEAIREFLGENPRARELRQMRLALEQRRDAMRRDLQAAADPAAKRALETRIAEAEKQISVLRDEETITDFVESSVRATLHKPPAEDLEF